MEPKDVVETKRLLKQAVKVLAGLDAEVLARAFGCKGTKSAQGQAEAVVRHALKAR